jgi:hypothetical protein
VRRVGLLHQDAEIEPGRAAADADDLQGALSVRRKAGPEITLSLK